MGLGCNAAGVTGCRIIDSPRERLIAILTNNFMPCKGRLPTLILIITLFLGGLSYGLINSVKSAAVLTGFILFGIIMTLIVSKLLSVTILKGVPSSYTLELPSYRIPQIGTVIVRSIIDRTLFVLGRAVSVAAPAGIIIYILANISVGGISILNLTVEALDPFARLIGLDGVILIAFILGFPANEITIPIMLMVYMFTGVLTEINSLSAIKALLIANGWTFKTALCTMMFSLLHWPCSTTLMSVHKETGSIKWTFTAFALPTVIAVLICGLINIIL